MSTTYYALPRCITSVRLTTAGGHDVLAIFTGGQLAGELRFAADSGDAGTILSALALETEVAHSHWGGTDRGRVITVSFDCERWPDSTPLIDDYGRLITLGELRAKDGSNAHPLGIATGVPT